MGILVIRFHCCQIAPNQRSSSHPQATDRSSPGLAPQAHLIVDPGPAPPPRSLPQKHILLPHAGRSPRVLVDTPAACESPHTPLHPAHPPLQINSPATTPSRFPLRIHSVLETARRLRQWPSTTAAPAPAQEAPAQPHHRWRLQVFPRRGPTFPPYLYPMLRSGEHLASTCAQATSW